MRLRKVGAETYDLPRVTYGSETSALGELYAVFLEWRVSKQKRKTLFKEYLERNAPELVGYVQANKTRYSTISDFIHRGPIEVQNAFFRIDTDVSVESTSVETAPSRQQIIAELEELFEEWCALPVLRRSDFRSFALKSNADLTRVKSGPDISQKISRYFFPLNAESAHEADRNDVMNSHHWMQRGRPDFAGSSRYLDAMKSGLPSRNQDILQVEVAEIDSKEAAISALEAYVTRQQSLNRDVYNKYHKLTKSEIGKNLPKVLRWIERAYPSVNAFMEEMSERLREIYQKTPEPKDIIKDHGNEVSALAEFEHLFQKWKSLPEPRATFNQSWVIQQGSDARRVAWMLINLDKEKRKQFMTKASPELQAHFTHGVMYNTGPAEERTWESVNKELEELFQMWKKIPKKTRPVFNRTWLREVRPKFVAWLEYNYNKRYLQTGGQLYEFIQQHPRKEIRESFVGNKGAT